MRMGRKQLSTKATALTIGISKVSEKAVGYGHKTYCTSVEGEEKKMGGGDGVSTLLVRIDGKQFFFLLTAQHSQCCAPCCAVVCESWKLREEKGHLRQIFPVGDTTRRI